MTEQQTNLSAEQLRAELARIEATENAELQRQQAFLEEQQTKYDEYVLETWRTEDHNANEEGRAARAQAVQALYEGKMDAAFKHYSQWHFSRKIRDQLRTEAQNAANRLNTVAEGANELRYVEFNFLQFVQSEGAQASEQHGNELFAQIYGDRPATYQDVAHTDPERPSDTTTRKG